MDNLNLNSDEEIIQRAQTIIINGVRHEAVLTGRRLILVESETGHVHEDIPYSDIEQVISGVNKLREPVITITFNSPEGQKQTRELIFIRLPGNLNIKDIEKAVAILKDHNVPVEGKVPLVDSVRLYRGDKADTGLLAVDEKASRPAGTGLVCCGNGSADPATFKRGIHGTLTPFLNRCNNPDCYRYNRGRLWLWDNC